MDNLEDRLNRLSTTLPAPPFTPHDVSQRLFRTLIHRRRRRERAVISGIALCIALFAFLFANLGGTGGPGFFDPTRVRAATPFPTPNLSQVMETLEAVVTTAP